MVKVDISREDSPEVLQDSMLASRGEWKSDVLKLIQKVSKTSHCSELITLWKTTQAKTHWANIFFWAKKFTQIYAMHSSFMQW